MSEQMSHQTLRGRLLLVDDEAGIRKTLGRALEQSNHQVQTAPDGESALSMIRDKDFDVVVVDNRMPGLSGIEMVRALAEGTDRLELPAIVMMTAHATVDNAIEAMKLGAFDYLQKPFDVDELLVVVQKALEHLRLRREHGYLLAERSGEFNDYGIVGKSSDIQLLKQKIKRVASSKSTVLITGETGTGKELVARAIHDQSAERDKPLVKVNCAAIPETLLESELFGHVRGAFTNATSNKRGKFALADGSSIFLDEIGMMSTAIQAKLLRVLQEREFEPLGSERTEKVETRVIAATNRDLEQEMSDGAFQEDLYFRLSVIPLVVSPLRERSEDIPSLVEHFLAKHCRRLGRPAAAVSAEALRRLCAYRWPGNVRELENTVERALVLSESKTLGMDELGVYEMTQVRSQGPPSDRLHENVEWVERETIRRALGQSGGVKKTAASMLGISQRALSYYLKKYDID